jgi:hypothetical protein
MCHIQDRSREYLTEINPVLSKALRVLRHAELFEPVRNLSHRGSASGVLAGSTPPVFNFLLCGKHTRALIPHLRARRTFNSNAASEHRDELAPSHVLPSKPRIHTLPHHWKSRIVHHSILGDPISATGHERCTQPKQPA